jgi:hypothetical protein
VFLRLLFILLSLPVGATVFKPQSVEDQIKEADGIVIGNFLKSKAIQLDDGSIATQMIFKMSKEFGMQSDLFGMDEIIIHYPGGTLGDQTVKVDGVPEFIPGENVALLIKSRSDRFWGLNLGMGSFKIINYGNETLVVNSIFPNDRRMSQIKLEEFERTIKFIKKSSLKTVLTPVYPSETGDEAVQRSPASSEGKNRAVASKTDKDENEEKKPLIQNLWLILLLAFMGGWFRLTRQKEAK